MIGGANHGDLDNFHDRFSAQKRAEMVMGESDKGSLGSGWHMLENPPDFQHAYRWCMGRAWFYLEPPAGTQALVLRLQSPVRAHRFALLAGQERLGECTIDAPGGEYCFALPASLPRGELLEFTIEAETLQPKAAGLSGDIRDLGVMVFAAKCTNAVPVGLRDGQHYVGRGFDRTQAPRRAVIRMGESDDGVLGVGFYAVEQAPGAVQAFRWCSGRAQFYLQQPPDARVLVARLASPLRPHALTVFAESQKLGEVTVGADTQEFRFLLPQQVPRGEVVEFTLQTQTVNPNDLGLSSDVRDLGVIVFELRAE
jgi:hypothetical protein